MAKFHWENVTREDVLEAIRIFNAQNPDYLEPRSTFLVVDGHKYPAKHIRGMAYRVHFNREIKKEDYAGGMETVRFFERLGFEMFYTGSAKKNAHPAETSSHTEKSAPTVSKTVLKEKPKEQNTSRKKMLVPSKGVIEQKNALQLLLNRLLRDDVVCEKTFPWMKTPAEFTDEYSPLYHALCAYRGNTGFAKKNVSLRCDFVCESRKLIIEYDERQHFSEARRIALMSYPQVPLCFDRQQWIDACIDIQAKDNQPINRDEIRAYYDSVRDIEAAKHGYRLIRIMHGQIDFESGGAYEKLAALLNVEKTEEPPQAPPQVQAQPAAAVGTPRRPIKIGLYLQTYELHGDSHAYERAMDTVRQSDIDILVFPEIAYFPFSEEYRKSDFLSDDDVQNMYQKTIELSRSIGSAVVVCNEDSYGTIMSIYANAFAEDGETVRKDYIKHTMTEFSACDIGNYREYAEEAFQPILYHGYRIGLTICYDCNHAMFSRKYGQNGVDIILNSTGGNVVYDKWFKYNKARAIENNCFTFVTMAGDGTVPHPHNYVYGFTPMGKEMPPRLLNGVDSGKRNVSGGIYVYDTAEYDGTAERDPSIDQAESVNQSSDFYLRVDGIQAVIDRAQPLADGLRVLKAGNSNLVLCLADGEEIMKPEVVLKSLYAEPLKQIANKRYLLINRWKTVDMDFYETKLSVILKVRAMENYCAVVLTSRNLTKCFQCGQNRTAQVVKSVDGTFGIDLKRTGGPETIWKDKTGMKARWRENIEWLISTMWFLHPLFRLCPPPLIAVAPPLPKGFSQRRVKINDYHIIQRLLRPPGHQKPRKTRKPTRKNPGRFCNVHQKVLKTLYSTPL